MDVQKQIKKCTKCNKYLCSTSFYKQTVSKDGLARQCKNCVFKYQQANKENISEYRKTYKKINRDSILEKKKKYYKANRQAGIKYAQMPERLYKVLEYSAKKRGHELEITINEFKNFRKTYTQCSYCPNELPKLGTGMDRLDNNKGYTLDNVVPCCKDCNRTRGDRLTHEEMKIAMNAVNAFRKEKSSAA